MNWFFKDKGIITYGKERAFSLVLFLSFFVYAASPLSFTIAGGEEVGGSACLSKTAGFSGNIGIFLWELIYKELASYKDRHPSDRTNRVLVKKARAILTENINPKSMCLGDVSETERIMPLLRSPLFAWAAPAGTEAKPQCYNPLRSGPSPPAV